MPKLDTLIAEVNDDLRDVLAPVAARFRFLLSATFDYIVGNPASTAAVAQTAVLASFTAQYADGLVSNLSASTVLTAFINRHGVGANLSQKWVSVRNWIVSHAGDKAAVLRRYEQGVYGVTPRTEADMQVLSVTPEGISVRIGPWQMELPAETLRAYMDGAMISPDETILRNVGVRLKIANADISNEAQVRAALHDMTFRMVN